MCDAGMCGPVDSILGRAVEPIYDRLFQSAGIIPSGRRRGAFTGALIR